ncbi:integrase catalytic domain-containing protein [Trichonephila clavipes]|nr:integrase catalytic domain-containing protein [Trichonephila clavipes]
MEVRSRSLKKCVSEVGVENIGFGKAKYFSFGCKTPKKQTCSKVEGRCDERSDCTSVHLVHSEDESISTELRRFWEIESLGILDKGSMTLGNGDEEILSEFDKSVNFVDGRYRVNLPWKPGMREALQNNKTVARKRFEGLVRRFKCDHELFCEYKDVIDDYVREGIVERTSCDSLLDSQGFYLPHHAVIRSDKTTSHIRIVFDGSAHEDGQSSLNQTDVKSAFLQIELDFRDRDFTRFFWTDNLNKEPYVLNFTRVLFGLRPSPYLLAATLKHHFKKYREQYPHTFELLNSSIYVDDLICGQNDVRTLYVLPWSACKYSVTQACYCANGRSNSKQLNLLWQQEGVKTESSETSAIDFRPPTKELWTLGVEWDSELPPKLRHKWQQWSSEAEGLTEIKIPRFYLGNIDQEIFKCEIHCFSDASKSAYGTILYLRFVTCNNEIETSFICSKGRVALLKSLTLPRLELTAALLSARLAKQVSSCLKFDANIYYWTDSLISYYWIRGDSSAFKPYIKNRVQEIQLLSDPMQWGRCPGKDNPADLLSRGTSAVKLAQNELWWHGPPWLKLTPDHWPNRHRDILDSELCSEELEHRSSVHVAVTQQREALVDINRFSSLKKLLKTTAWVFRFVNIARNIYKLMDFYINADKGIHWKFIVERVPWWGGFYERLVKTKKDPLRKILDRALLTFEELSTILSEVEVIVNHRPLTYVENDPGEPEPLTPAHFFELGYGDSKYPIHFIELIDATTAKESYKKRKTYRTLLLKQLCRRWKEQYLIQLKTANHFKTPSVHKNLKLNDVVLVEGNVKSKLLWELGIIKEIFIGRDDNVRSCLVKTFKGLFKKPIQLLYPLEIV